jgi:hypothetical protein
MSLDGEADMFDGGLWIAEWDACGHSAAILPQVRRGAEKTSRQSRLLGQSCRNP